MKLQRGVHSYFKIVPLETDQKSPPPSRFSLNSSFFFFQGKKILSGGKIPPDTLLLRGKAVLYIVACQFLTFEDRSGLKLNFPANLPREREWFCNRVDVIVSCVTLHEGKGRKFSFPRLSKLARKEKEKKNGEERKMAIACSWWFESESEEYTVLITATGAFSRQKDQLLSTDF